MSSPSISIGALARRSGVAASALRFYEQQGLIRSSRSAGNQRVYPGETLRRVAFVRVAQGVGLSLSEIASALASLPEERTPTRADWSHLSAAWRTTLQARIDTLSRLRDQLDSCIGCGCLSLAACALYNPDDAARHLGSGPRFLWGDRPSPAAPEELSCALPGSSRGAL